MYTVTAARTRLRHIMYSVGAHGHTPALYSTATGYNDPRQRYCTRRAGSYGTITIPWKHPLYWNPDGTPIPDEL
jgi:hypothetical protein